MSCFFDENGWEEIRQINTIYDVPENRMQNELPSEHVEEAHTFFTGQREFAVISGSDGQTFIGTNHLGPNVCLIGWEPTLKVAFCAHYDINTKIDLEPFNSLPEGVYECYILGGLSGYSEMLIEGIYKLTRLIETHEFILCGRCILGSVYDIDSIFISKANGKIYTYNEYSNDSDFWHRGNKFRQIINNRTSLQVIAVNK